MAGYGPSGFTANNVVGNYLSGQRAADSSQANMQQYQQNILTQQQNTQNQNQVLLNQDTKNQQAAAKELYLAAQYSLEIPKEQTKAFVEKNFPALVAHAGDKWASATDDDVQAELQGARAQFGSQSGTGPASAKGVSGAMYKVVDPETGEITYATAQEANGKNPYVYKPPTKAVAGEKRPAPPRGFRYKEDGSVEPIPGGPNDPNSPNRPTQSMKPPTEGDKRARVMYSSMKNAEKQLEAVTTADTSDLGQAILGKTDAGKVLQSQEYKRYEAAGLRWAANLLYLKSGATATPDEIRSTYIQFLPQPGDGQGVKDQKNEARAQELGSINEAYSFEAPRPGNAPAPVAATQATPQQQAPAGQRLTPEQASQLPSGTSFVGMDGVTRVKH